MNELMEELVAAIVSKFGDNLPNLSFPHNNLRQIEHIFRFSSVRDLNLSCNRITDISPLASMTQLEEVNLSENYM